MKNRLLLPVISSLLLISSCVEKTPDPIYDLVIVNANVVYPDSSCTGCFITTLDGKIESVEKGEFNGNAQEVLDVQNAYVYAGFIDAHAHFFAYGKKQFSVDLTGTTSWDEVVARTVEFAEENSELDFIMGRGWDQNDWEQKDFPTMEALNEAFPNTPIVLTRIDGHASIVNQKALDDNHITALTKIEGGQVQSVKGNPTGILLDNAIDLISFPDLTESQAIRCLELAETDCLAQGLTTIDDAGLSKSIIDLIDEEHRIGALKIRIYAMVSDEIESIEYYLKAGPYKTDRLNVRSFKFYGDGALGSRGACLIHPYHDSPNESGFLLSSIEHFEKSAALMAEAGFQMNTHAIGDSANRVILNIYKKYNTSESDLRWRIEHAQVIHPADFHLFREHNIIPSVQPTHATSDMYWADERLGEERLKSAYAYNDLLNQSGTVALGTDFPVEEISPIKTFYAAVARKDVTGYPEGGFQMENALSRADALRGMTEWAAFANFEENEKGSISPGKWADFTILDTDLIQCPEEDILQTKVLFTLIGGEVVYTNDTTKK